MRTPPGARRTGTKPPARNMDGIMQEVIAKSLLRVAILMNPSAIEGVRFTCYEWRTETAYRVLLRLEDGAETDVDYDRVTGCYRVWVDGVECGNPGWN